MFKWLISFVTTSHQGESDIIPEVSPCDQTEIIDYKKVIDNDFEIIEKYLDQKKIDITSGQRLIKISRKDHPELSHSFLITRDYKTKKWSPIMLTHNLSKKSSKEGVHQQGNEPDGLLGYGGRSSCYVKIGISKSHDGGYRKYAVKTDKGRMPSETELSRPTLPGEVKRLNHLGLLHGVRQVLKFTGRHRALGGFFNYYDYKTQSIMEFAPGVTLAQLLENSVEDITLSQNDKAKILYELGLQILKMRLRGVIHEDLHFNNIMVHKDGSKIEVRLIDFDKAQLVNQSSILGSIIAFLKHPLQFLHRKFTGDFVVKANYDWPQLDFAMFKKAASTLLNGDERSSICKILQSSTRCFKNQNNCILQVLKILAHKFENKEEQECLTETYSPSLMTQILYLFNARKTLQNDSLYSRYPEQPIQRDLSKIFSV